MKTKSERQLIKLEERDQDFATLRQPRKETKDV
jgi:hypothetical protein